MASLFGRLRRKLIGTRSLDSRFRARRTKSRGELPLHRRLALEPLEDRVLLSVAPDIEWTRQFGSVEPALKLDSAYAADADGNVYVAGSTGGTLPGQTSAGGRDAFVRKYDSSGTELWTRQFGSSGFDLVRGMSVDADGNVYVTGDTDVTLPGQTNSGGRDAFVRKYDANGTELWTRQFGTSSSELIYGISVDASGVYMAGQTSGTLPGQTNAGGGDAFIRKYDANGSEVWTRQFGTTSWDWARGISMDASGVYLAGMTTGTFAGQTNEGGQDAFVRKYTLDGLGGTDGNGLLWTRQFGTSSGDVAEGISADASGVYVAGQTAGTLPGQTNAGAWDAFVRKYDSDGNEVWTRQFGSSATDAALGISVNASGVYLAGEADDALPGQTGDGGVGDAFVRKYDSDGNEVWTRQFGTAEFDVALGVSVGASAVYVVGETEGTFPGQTSAGSTDVFVQKYDVSGAELWTRQFGSVVSASELDLAKAVDADGNVYVAGSTGGTLPGQTSEGGQDAFVRKYDSNGTEVWTRQFGTSYFDRAWGISLDASGVYVAGVTQNTLPDQISAGNRDAFVRKYDSNGTELWTRQFGTSSNDEAEDISVDASGVYVAGHTGGTFAGQTNAGGEDAFVRKYDASGTEIWTRQFGTTTTDWAYGISVDASGIYVAGEVGSTLPGQTSAGSNDAFVRKYDSNGTEVWTRQFGTSSYDEAFGISVDASGVYVAGETGGTLPGQTSAGESDAFVRKYDSDGTEVWTRQFGTSSYDLANGISVGTSAVYVVGETAGTFAGQTSVGSTDAFVAKLSIAEPLDPFVVTSTLDAVDELDGMTTLREAILAANATLGTDTIAFNIPGVGVQTIRLLSGLPMITDPVIIDGYTQPGASPNTNPVGSGLNTVLMIELDGTNSGTGPGLNIGAGNSVVRGLVVNRFNHNGIHVWGSGDNVIEGNFIGTDPTGTVALGNSLSGVRLYSANNVVGGTTPEARNLIAANGHDGVTLANMDASGNVVQGNLIGTDLHGTADLGNSLSGVAIAGPNNTIGGTTPGAGNVISGNQQFGVRMDGIDVTSNLVQGNFIGTDVTGAADLGNTMDGVRINGATDNVIGGTEAGARNVISGNDESGVSIESQTATGNVVSGNIIGLNAAGDTALKNNFYGVMIEQASNNTIGGSVAAARNVIGGRAIREVYIVGVNATGNVVQGNYIGTDATGMAAHGASQDGIMVEAGATTIADNLVSGNERHGVFLGFGSHVVTGNVIGLNAVGDSALGNAGNGIYITDLDNVIGGTTAGEGNIISGNVGSGIEIFHDRSVGNTIRGNSIFANQGLGIDLNSDGPTPNDAADVDTGPNNLQNFPVFDSALTDGGGTVIAGTLNSMPNSTFQLDLFSNTAADASGHGEGETYLGSTTVTTDGSGNAGFTATFPTPVPVGQLITATVTDPDGNTSEFSAAVVVTPNQPPTADPGGPYTVAEGSDVMLDASASFDLDQPNGTLTYEWDLDNDGVFDDATGITHSFSAGDGPAVLDISLRVTDDFGASDIAATTVTINNVAPSGSLLPIPPVNEGDEVTVTFGTVIDPSPADHAAGFTYSYDFDNDGVFEIVDSPSNQAQVPAEFVADGPAEHLVMVWVKDKDGGSTGGGWTMVVNNAAPAITSLAETSPIDENGVVTLNGAFINVGTQDTHSVLIDWGDASSDLVDLNVQTLTLNPAADRGGEDTDLDGVFDVLLPEDGDRFRIRLGGTADRRGAFEFDAGGVPVGSVIRSARFQVGVVGIGGTADYEVHGYSGNGNIELADLAVSNLVADPFTIGTSTLANIDVDVTTFLQSLVDNGDSIGGFMVKSVSPSTGEITVASAEYPTDVTWPRLVVEWIPRSFTATHTYLDDNPTATDSDLYTITATVTDDDGGSDAATASVTVDNVAPILGSLLATTIDENGTTTLTGTITDPGTLDTFTLDVNWGDPLSPNNVEQYSFMAGTTSFSLNHQYLDDNPTNSASGDYTIGLTITDDDTVIISADDAAFGVGAVTRDPDQGLGFLDPSFSLNRSFADVSGEFGPGGDFEGFRYATELEVVTLVNNFGFSPGAAAGSFTEGDTGSDQLAGLMDLVGAIDTSGGSLPRRETNGLTGTVGNPGGRRIFLIRDVLASDANDDAGFNGSFPDGDSGTSIGSWLVRPVPEFSTTVTVNNVAPSGSLLPISPVNEGDEVTVTFGTVSDPSPADHAAGFTYSYDFDNDGVFEIVDSPSNQAQVPAEFVADGPAEHLVMVWVKDKDGDSTGGGWTMVVNNVAPTVSISGRTTVVRGEPLSYTFSATDVAADLATLDYAIDWDGDGVVDQTESGGASIQVDHIFQDAKTYTIKATATDKDGGTSSEAQLAVGAGKAMRSPIEEKIMIGATKKTAGMISRIIIRKGSLEIYIDDDPPIIFTDPTITGVIVYGQDADDEIIIEPNLSLDGGLTFLSAELHGGPGDDVLQGGTGDNLIFGGDGHDVLIGGTGTNTLAGGDGDDMLQDGGGTNTVIGGSGSNTFVPGGGTNTFEAEPGSTTPEVFTDAYVTAEDDVLSVAAGQGVLANDTDPNGSGLSAALVSGPSEGVLSLAGDGSFLYEPRANYYGADSFTYRATNGSEQSGDVTVDIAVKNRVDLSGRVFDDRNNDGLFDSGDVGIGGATVSLYDQTDGTPIDTQTTATDGTYTFDANLGAGTYKIVEVQPTAFLDGMETAGGIGGAIDITQDFNEITDIEVGDPGTTPDGDGYNFAEIEASDIQGLVWEDFNNDGQVDFGEKAIDNVTVTLTGTDDRGHAIDAVSIPTDTDGMYMFIDLRPGDYTISETPPSGFRDGKDVVGTINGSVNGDNDGGSPPLSTTNDQFTLIEWSLPGSVGENYNFAERPLVDGVISAGQTATIGYWQNNNGQALINALTSGDHSIDDSVASTQLGDWLATTLPNMYGDDDVGEDNANDLTGKTNAAVASFYRALFRRKKKEAVQLGLGGPTKVDAQVMAVALSSYVTNDTLAGQTAEDYGFLVTEHGVGNVLFNVGESGDAFGLMDYSDAAILDLLLAINDRSLNGRLYDIDGDRDADDEWETLLRTLANDVFSSINEQGSC